MVVSGNQELHILKEAKSNHIKQVSAAACRPSLRGFGRGCWYVWGSNWKGHWELGCGDGCSFGSILFEITPRFPCLRPFIKKRQQELTLMLSCCWCINLTSNERILLSGYWADGGLTEILDHWELRVGSLHWISGARFWKRPQRYSRWCQVP